MQKHILIIDDDPNFRFSTELSLRRKGYQVSQSGDGKEGLEAIIRANRIGCPFDLILLDMDLPSLSGDQIIQQLNDREIATPVLVVSGGIDPELYNDLTVLGCLSIYFKPVNEKVLVERVGQLLNQ